MSARAVVTSAQAMYSAGHRVEASYHASPGVKALRFLKHWQEVDNTRQVDELARVADIFNGPRFARIYVTDPERGVPFLSSSDMLQADLSGVKLLSRKHTPARLLKAIKLSAGWTLISCSGTVGNTVYVRPDMDGMTGSQHIMRVAPKGDTIPSGYLYTFLSSSLGYALVTRGIYGGLIQHIEPAHIADLPIPRLDPATEQRIHGLIERAAALRVAANEELRSIRYDITMTLDLATDFSARYDHAYATGCKHLNDTASRLDAYYYIGYAGQAAEVLQQSSVTKITLAEATTEIFNPPIFKRIYVGAEGMPYLMGAEIYETYPRPSRYISRSTKDLERYVLHEGMIIIQDAGQRYGLLGTPIYGNRTLEGMAATNNMIRIVSPDRQTAGYLFAFLDTEVGRRLIVRESYGSSLPHIFPPWLSNIPVPWPEFETRNALGERVIAAFDKRAEANEHEDTAQALLLAALGWQPSQV
jgi:type I restriction enzyme S subunit